MVKWIAIILVVAIGLTLIGQEGWVVAGWNLLTDAFSLTVKYGALIVGKLFAIVSSHVAVS